MILVMFTVAVNLLKALYLDGKALIFREHRKRFKCCFRRNNRSRVDIRKGGKLDNASENVKSGRYDLRDLNNESKIGKTG